MSEVLKYFNIDLTYLKNKFNIDFLNDHKDKIDNFVSKKWLIFDQKNNKLIATYEGMMVLDQIILDLDGYDYGFIGGSCGCDYHIAPKDALRDSWGNDDSDDNKQKDLLICFAGDFRFIIDPVNNTVVSKTSGKW